MNAFFLIEIFSDDKLEHDATMSTKLTCDCFAVYLLRPTNHLARRNNSEFANGLCSTFFSSFLNRRRIKQRKICSEKDQEYILIHTAVRKSTADKHRISHSVCQLSQGRKHMNQIFAALQISFIYQVVE